jgi:hypothetical protein
MAVLADRTYDYILQLLGFDRLAYPDHPVIEALKNVSNSSASRMCPTLHIQVSFN